MEKKKYFDLGINLQSRKVACRIKWLRRIAVSLSLTTLKAFRINRHFCRMIFTHRLRCSDVLLRSTTTENILFGAFEQWNSSHTFFVGKCITRCCRTVKHLQPFKKKIQMLRTLHDLQSRKSRKDFFFSSDIYHLLPATSLYFIDVLNSRILTWFRFHFLSVHFSAKNP